MKKANNPSGTKSADTAGISKSMIEIIVAAKVREVHVKYIDTAFMKDTPTGPLAVIRMAESSKVYPIVGKTVEEVNELIALWQRVCSLPKG